VNPEKKIETIFSEDGGLFGLVCHGRVFTSEIHRLDLYFRQAGESRR
jgi:hypothetical protein